MAAASAVWDGPRSRCFPNKARGHAGPAGTDQVTDQVTDLTAGSSPGHVVVTCGPVRRVLASGQALAFGRGTGQDLRMGHDPDVLTVPRAAGRLECRPDGVLIHNASGRADMIFRPVPGTEKRIDPLSVVGTRPHEHVQVVVPAKDTAFVIDIVDRRKLPDFGRPVEPARPGEDPPTVAWPGSRT